MDSFDVLTIMALFFIILVGSLGIISISQSNEKINELGTAICEETYGEGSEFESYRDKKVTCTDPRNQERFDGLIVEVE